MSPPLAASVVIGTTLANQKIAGKYTAKGAFRVITAGWLLGFVMYAVNSYSAEVGSAFSGFIVVVALLANGVPVIQRLGGI